MPFSLLYYIHDPLCGWCYAAAPLVDTATAAGFAVALHGGGLWEQNTRLTREKRNYIRHQDQRIAELAGRPFGTAYLGELLSDPDTRFGSRPAMGAILASGQLRDGADLEMLHAIQTAHYLQGRRVVETSVLVELAGQIGLNPAAFTEIFHACRVDEHIQDSRRWMSRFGLRGFPSFILERNGSFASVPHEVFYSSPEAFVRALHASA